MKLYLFIILVQAMFNCKFHDKIQLMWRNWFYHVLVYVYSADVIVSVFRGKWADMCWLGITVVPVLTPDQCQYYITMGVWTVTYAWDANKRAITTLSFLLKYVSVHILLWLDTSQTPRIYRCACSLQLRLVFLCFTILNAL